MKFDEQNKIRLALVDLVTDPATRKWLEENRQEKLRQAFIALDWTTAARTPTPKTYGLRPGERTKDDLVERAKSLDLRLVEIDGGQSILLVNFSPGPGPSNREYWKRVRVEGTGPESVSVYIRGYAR